MISFNELSTYIQNKLITAYNGLNNPLMPIIDFNIVSDTGKIKTDYVENNALHEVINGVVTLGVNERFFLSNGLSVSSIPLTLEVIFRLEDDEENGGVVEEDIENGTIEVTQAFIGNAEKIQNVRNILDTAFNQEQIIDTITGEDGKDYVASIVANIAQSGTRSIVPTLGLSYTFLVSFNVNVVENGINSRQGTFKLDGVEIPFTTFSIMRVKNVDSVILSNANGESSALPNFSLLSFTFDLPALSDSSPTATFLNDLIFNHLNDTHVLKFKLNGIEKDYLVHITENTGTVSGVQNVGLKIVFSIAPPYYEFLTFGEWNVVQNLNQSQNIALNKDLPIVIFSNTRTLARINYRYATISTTEIAVYPNT